MAVNDFRTMTPAVNEWAQEVVLAQKQPKHIFTIPAMRKNMPAGKGRVNVFTRYDRLEPNLNPVLNTTPPDPSIFTAIDVKVEPKEYLQYAFVSSTFVLQMDNPVLNEFSGLLGVANYDRQDILMREVLASCATVFNCTSGFNGDNPTEPTATDLQTAITFLRMNNAKTTLDQVDPGPNLGTGPVSASYPAMCHTALEKDLKAIPGFLKTVQYGTGNKALRAEVGAYDELRFLTSTLGKIRLNASGIAGADVYDINFQGVEATGIVRQDNFSTEVYFRDENNFIGKLKVELGVKAMDGQAIFQEDWVGRLAATLS